MLSDLAGAVVDIAGAVASLEEFSGRDLGRTLSRIEREVEGCTLDQCQTVLVQSKVVADTLAGAGLVKRLAGQVNVAIHALGVLLCLPELLAPDETIQSLSLGAGNTGKAFDLETDRRVAEFKFISWQGGPEAIRQNSLFKDFYCLAEHESSKSKHLYVLGTDHPLKFLNGRRALESVLSKNVSLHREFRAKYPGYRVVRDYYLPRRDLVLIEDVSGLLPALTGSLEI